jgi:hypothetical protein
VVGGPLDDVATSVDQGSAYVFVRTGASWTEQQQLFAVGGSAADNVGWNVALSGDTALLGSPTDDVGSITDQGSAYVFIRVGTNWSQQQQLLAGDGAAFDDFGFSVALSGDTALVGANTDDVGLNTGQGSAFVFARTATSWSFQKQLIVGDGAAFDNFGTAVALSGGSAVVGMPGDDVVANAGAGSAYIFLLDGVSPTTIAAVAPAANAAGWHKRPPTISLTASDDLSGVAVTEQRGGGAAVFAPYAGPFQVSNEGVSIVEFRSSDVAGNLEATKSITVRLDMRRPATKAFATSVKRGQKAKLRYKVSDALPGSGKAKVTLKLFKGAKLRKTIRVPGFKAVNVIRSHGVRLNLPAGRYTVKVFASDLAGNAQSKVGSARLTVK